MTNDDSRCAEERNEAKFVPLYRDKRTERFANGEQVRAFQAVERQAKKRLRILLDSVS